MAVPGRLREVKLCFVEIGREICIAMVVDVRVIQWLRQMRFLRVRSLNLIVPQFGSAVVVLFDIGEFVMIPLRVLLPCCMLVLSETLVVRFFAMEVCMVKHVLLIVEGMGLFVGIDGNFLTRQRWVSNKVARAIFGSLCYRTLPRVSDWDIFVSDLRGGMDGRSRGRINVWCSEDRQLGVVTIVDPVRVFLLDRGGWSHARFWMVHDKVVVRGLLISVVLHWHHLVNVLGTMLH